MQPELAHRSRHSLEAAREIAAGIAESGVWPYLAGLSDLVSREAPDRLRFSIAPSYSLAESEIERVVVMPSFVASQRLSAYGNGATLFFAIAIEAHGPFDDPPEALLASAMAVCDRTRLKMLKKLASAPCGNLEIAEYLGVNPSTTSRHFKLFRDAGFVECAEGSPNRLEYRLAGEAVERALAAIAEYVRG